MQARNGATAHQRAIGRCSSMGSSQVLYPLYPLLILVSVFQKPILLDLLFHIIGGDQETAHHF
jgi:hypothetical protein